MFCLSDYLRTLSCSACLTIYGHCHVLLVWLSTDTVMFCLSEYLRTLSCSACLTIYGHCHVLLVWLSTDTVMFCLSDYLRTLSCSACLTIYGHCHVLLVWLSTDTVMFCLSDYLRTLSCSACLTIYGHCHVLLVWLPTDTVMFCLSDYLRTLSCSACLTTYGHCHVLLVWLPTDTVMFCLSDYIYGRVARLAYQEIKKSSASIARVQTKKSRCYWSFWPWTKHDMEKINSSAQLSMKFFLLINVKMPTIVGILTFTGRKKNFFGLYDPEKCWFSRNFFTFQISCSAELSITSAPVVEVSVCRTCLSKVRYRRPAFRQSVRPS